MSKEAKIKNKLCQCSSGKRYKNCCGTKSGQPKSQVVVDYFLNKEAEQTWADKDKHELYKKLKGITNYYVLVLHQLKGYHQDSLSGFQAYLKDFEASQISSCQKLNLSISEVDKAQLIYMTGGAPNDPKVIMHHECTQGELKTRLGKGNLNENLLGYFCLSMMYEYWEDIRGKLAVASGLDSKDIVSDIFGDMRNLRNDIVHNKGVASKKYSDSNKLLKWFKEEEIILITTEKLDEITGKIFDFMSEFVLECTGHKPYMDYSLSQIAKQRQMEHIRDNNMKVQR